MQDTVASPHKPISNKRLVDDIFVLSATELKEVLKNDFIQCSYLLFSIPHWKPAERGRYYGEWFMVGIEKKSSYILIDPKKKHLSNNKIAFNDPTNNFV